FTRASVHGILALAEESYGPSPPHRSAVAAPAAPAAHHPGRPSLPPNVSRPGGQSRHAHPRGRPTPGSDAAQHLPLDQCLRPGTRPRGPRRCPAERPPQFLGAAASATAPRTPGPVAPAAGLCRRGLDGPLAPGTPPALHRPVVLRRHDSPRVAAAA